MSQLLRPTPLLASFHPIFPLSSLPLPVDFSFTSFRFVVSRVFAIRSRLWLFSRGNLSLTWAEFYSKTFGIRQPRCNDRLRQCLYFMSDFNDDVIVFNWPFDERETALADESAHFFCLSSFSFSLSILGRHCEIRRIEKRWQKRSEEIKSQRKGKESFRLEEILILFCLPYS